MGLGHWLDQAFDSVNDIVQKKLLPDEVVNPLTGAAGAAIDFIGHSTKAGALDALDALKWNRDNIISPTIASVLGAAGTTNPNEHHYEPLINPLNYVSNFKAARGHKQQATDKQGNLLVDKKGKPAMISTGLSPFQTAYGQGARAAGVLSRDVGAGGVATGILGPAAAVGSDITKPNERDAAFDSWTNAGRYTTGIGDAALSWYADPTVILGKTAMIARSRALIKPISEGAMRSSEIERITTAAPGLAEDAGLLARTREKVLTPFDAQRRITRMTDDLAAMQPAERADFLARNTSMRGAPGLISLMSRAPDSDAMRMVLRYAMDPNPLTKATLENKWGQAIREVDRLRETKIPELENSLADLKTRMGTYLGDGGTKVGQMAIDSAQRELSAAELSEKYYSDVLTVRGTLRSVPRVNVRQALTRGAEESRFHLDWDVLQPSRYGVATRILKSAGEKRAGVIDVNRTGDPTEQLRRFLDRVGHGLGVGLPVTVKDGLMVDMAHAETKGPAAVMDVVQRAEEHALLHYAKHSRVEGETDQAIADNVRAILDATHTRREAVRGKFGMVSRDSTYTGAPRLDAAGQPTGRLLDEVQDGLGIWSHNPLTESQFTDRIPMLDVDRLAKVMNRHRLAMVGENRGHFLAALRGEGGAIANLNAIGTEALEGLNRYWKPAQLARLGWPIRVITDENLRIYSILGAMSVLPLQLQSTVRGVGQTRPAYKVRDILASKQVLASKHAIAHLVEDRSGGKVREGLVNDLEDLNAHLSAYDTVIPKLAQQLLEQDAALQGTALHAFTGPRGTLRQGPGGVTMNFGGLPLGDRAADQLGHERIGLTEHHPAVYHTQATDTDPGIATLRDALDGKEFVALHNMPVDKLRQKLIYAGVDPKHADRLTDRQKLLSLYGKQIARNAGHKAIVHGAETRTYTALHPDALRTADRTEMEKTADLLHRLTDARDTVAAARQHLTGRIETLPAWSKDQEERWGELVASALKPSQRAKVLGKPGKFSGTVKMHLASGESIDVPDAGAGVQGQVSMSLASASGTMRDLAGLDRRQINKMRLQVGDPVTILPTTTETGKLAELHQLSYDRAYEKAVNNQIAHSMIGRMILAGEDNDAIVTALRRTKQGRDLMRMNPVRASDPHQWVEDVEQHVNHYLPTPELKYAASQGIATAQMLKDTFPVAALRPVIHGESLEVATGRNAMTSFMERRIEGLYQKLGTTPTDALSRHPFFTAHYRQEMQRQLSRSGAQSAEEISTADMEKMMRAAREHSLAQVKGVLYDTANSTHLGHAVRFVSPFFNAWAEALTVWGKLWMEDPSRIARLVQAWNAPTKMHVTYTDSFGVEQVALPLPPGVAKAMGAKGTGIPKNTLEQLIFQGQFWWMPGAGVPVTVPLGEFVRHRPDKADSVKPFLPYGAGANPLADILPSTFKKGATLAKQEDDPTYVADWLKQLQQLATDRSLHKNTLTDAQLIAEAHHRASAVSGFKLLTSLVAPAQISIRPEYQMYYDQLRALQEQYRAYPGGKDPQGHRADEAFLAANGDDFFYLLGGSTKSNIGGISPTDEGYRASKKYAKDIRANPQWGKFFVGNEDQGAYSPQVEKYQKATRIGGGNMERQRSQVQPGDVIKDAQAQQGWDEFRRINTMVDNALKERGLTSINVAAAADLKEAKKKLVDRLEEKLPQWKLAKSEFTLSPQKTDRFVAMVQDHFARNDPEFNARPGFTTLARYMATRNTMVRALAERKAAGGTNNLQAGENQDLLDAWDILVGKLRLQDTAFADLQSRWLQGDRMESGGKF